MNKPNEKGDIAFDLIVAMIDHDAKAKFAVFCQDVRLEEYIKGKWTKEEYYADANFFTKELERNVTAYCTCKSIFEKHFGTLPDLSWHVEAMLKYYKIANGWEEAK